MKIDRIHHVAYRCKDAKETVLWSRRLMPTAPGWVLAGGCQRIAL